MEFEINNKETLAVKQESGYDTALSVITLDNNNLIIDKYLINPNDFVTMLNWYQYQKSNGNEELEF